MAMKYLHTMVRVKDLEASMAFYQLLGLRQTRRNDYEQGRFSLIFMAAPGDEACPVELTYNWDGDAGLPSDSRHFGHLAYAVDDIYATCQHLMDNGVTINRPPRYGRMAFVRSPTISPSNCCKQATPSHPPSLGPRWAIRVTGDPRGGPWIIPLGRPGRGG